MRAPTGTYEVVPGMSSGMAVGVLARQGNSTTPFEATWDYLRVQEILQSSQAVVEVTPTGGLNWNNNAFKIKNISTGGEQIVSVRFRLASALLPDMVFDPVWYGRRPYSEKFHAKRRSRRNGTRWLYLRGSSQ